MEIQIIDTERFGYSILCNGEIILECLTKDEVDALTIKEIEQLYRESVEDVR